MRIAFVALSTLAVGVALVLLARRLAVLVGFVAAPRTDRWHQKTTPLLGGAAIYATFVLGFIVFAPSVARAYPILAAAR